MSPVSQKQIHRYTKLELQISIIDKLEVINKDGYYIGSNILFDFDLGYLNMTLLSWESLDKREFNQHLKNSIDKNWGYIKSTAFELISHRHEVLACIFDLYQTKNYIALIPLVLSQIDGIVKEITENRSGLYNSKNGKLSFLDQIYMLILYQMHINYVLAIKMITNCLDQKY